MCKKKNPLRAAKITTLHHFPANHVLKRKEVAGVYEVDDGGVELTDWQKVAQTHLLVLGAHLCSQLIQTSAEGLLAVVTPGLVQAGSQLQICGCRHW